MKANYRQKDKCFLIEKEAEEGMPIKLTLNKETRRGKLPEAFKYNGNISGFEEALIDHQLQGCFWCALAN